MDRLLLNVLVRVPLSGVFPDRDTKVAILEYDIGISSDNWFAKLNRLME